MTRIEWRHGEYHVHIIVELTELRVTESVIPLGPVPPLPAAVSYFSKLAGTVANMQIGDLSISKPRRGPDGSLRTQVHLTVYRPGESAVSTATAAAELEKVLAGMLEEDERTLLKTRPHLFD